MNNCSSSPDIVPPVSIESGLYYQAMRKGSAHMMAQQEHP